MSFFFKQKIRLKDRSSLAGFSLIEMIVVIAIFMIITGVVLSNLPAFRDQSSLDLVAQEIAINIRGAQSYAMGSLADSGIDLVYGYAIQFSTAQENNKQFKIYALSDSQYNLFTKPKETYDLKGGFYIDCLGGLQMSNGVASCSGNQSSLDIKFKRPSGALVGANVNMAVRVRSVRDNTKSRIIGIYQNGQIVVYKGS